MFANIENLLKQKAPLIYDALQGPTEESKIDELEKLVGAELPYDFKLMYRCRNGIDQNRIANLFYGFPFLEIDAIIGAQENLLSNNDVAPLKYADPEIKRDYTFGIKRIPFGDDSGTSLLCVDLDPSDAGIYGQVIMVDYEMGVALKLNSSIEDLVRQFEADLSNSKYSLQEDALEVGDHWLHPIREIDPGNWFNSPRWQYVKTALRNS